MNRVSANDTTAKSMGKHPTTLQKQISLQPSIKRLPWLKSLYYYVVTDCLMQQFYATQNVQF